MRLLILGGSWFVGHAVVAEAVRRGWEVTLFNRGRSARPPSRSLQRWRRECRVCDGPGTSPIRRVALRGRPLPSAESIYLRAGGVAVERVPGAPVSLRVGALRVGIVLAASGPVVLRAFALGPADMYGMICWRLPATVPFLLSQTTTWGLLSLAELLLPVILAGLFVLSSRWSVRLGAVAVLAVLAFRLLATVRDVDPFTGRLLQQSPWLPIVCYGAAFLMLAAMSPSPRSPAGRQVVVWTAAAVAAAWTAARLPFLLQAETVSSFGWTAVGEPRSLWNYPGLWSCKADVDGLLVVLVALVATASTVLADRPRRRLGLATALLLVLAAVEGYLAATIMMDAEKLRQEFQLEAVMLMRWHLLVAAALVVAADFGAGRRAR